jgi:general transcription factor 3C polypeptide 3 (transcription factor C subunit 4)
MCANFNLQQSYFDYPEMGDEIPVIFEELESSELPDHELSEFVETKPMSMSFDGASTSTYTPPFKSKPSETDQKQKGNLIKRFIKGDLDYFDVNVQSDEEDDDEDYVYDSDDQDESLVQNKKDFKSKPSGSKPSGMRRKRHMLPIALQGLMGQANLCFARGEVDMAEKLCLEIIRQVHLAAEPYLTLAQIYEGKDIDKFIQFSLIAAYLEPNESEQWIRLADLLIEQGNIKKAVSCYTRSLKVDRSNVDIHLKRIELLKSIGEEALAFR